MLLVTSTRARSGSMSATTPRWGSSSSTGAEYAKVLVYPKPDHKPAVFTVLNLPVRDIETTVDSLIAAGIPMEHYDGDDGPKTDARASRARLARGRVAWFRDPDRNILAVMQVPGR